MGMTVSDAAFVEKRRRLVRLGTIVPAICLALLAGFGIWLYFRQPRLINFVEVARQIESGSIDPLTVELMAIMLPIVMLMCLVVMAGAVALAWAVFANERRYLRIVDGLSKDLKDV